MLMGITLKASPTNEQRSILSQWMGCARFIWNAKCEENNYLSKFAMRYLPTGTYPDIDQTYSQYKNPELSPWLSKCPSQILRNSAANWYNTFCNFKKGDCACCGHSDNADHNAAEVIKKKAINLILNSGTKLLNNRRS